MKYLQQFEQQLNQVIGESVANWLQPKTKILAEAKGHLDHPEDDVFISDDSGADAINAMMATAKNPKNITIKWDGYPALIFGRGPDGKFTILDKHMFNRGVRNLNTVEDWIANEQSRGEKTRSELIDIVKEIWPALEKECQGKGYYWGDLLFRRPLTAKNGKYTFRANPNGITYTVDANSNIGKLLANKVAGIAVHQYIAPTAASTDEATSLNGSIGELKNNSNVAIVPSAMPVAPTVQIDKSLLANAKSSVSKYGPKVQEFFNNAPQNKTAFTQLFTTYLNSRIVGGNLSNLVDGFIQWIEQRFGKQVDTSKLSASMGGKLHDYIVSNKKYVEMAFKIWIDIYNLKNSMVAQLDQAAKSSPVKGFLDDGTETQEGFVSNGYKFINRMGFARQNLAARPAQVNEATDQGRVVIVYGGGFQPFHAGHLSSYLQAKKAFPNADIYVAASNDTSTRPIPFEDKKFLAQQAGVGANFVQVKTPLNPKEILSNYDPEKDKFVLVRSERDPVTYTKKDGSPGYYQPMTSVDKMEPFGRHAYVLVTKRHDFELDGKPVYSGTQVRDMYKNADDAGKMKIISQLYPKSTKQKLIKQKLDSFLADGVMESTQSYALDLSKIQREFGNLIVESNGQYHVNKVAEQKFLKYAIANNVNPMLVYFAINQQIEQQFHGNTITESINQNNEAELKYVFDTFDKFASFRAKVGDKICLLDLAAEDFGTNNRSITLSGFKTPKQVTRIDSNQIQFTDGSVYPSKSVMQTRMWRRIAIFGSEEALEKCLMAMNLLKDKINSIDGDWNFEINLEQSLEETDNPMFFGGNSESPIPGTPEDLGDPRTWKEKQRDARKQAKQAREMRRWMGHYN